MGTRTTRMAVELIEAAELEALKESRSAREQLDHWTRLGMHISVRNTAARRQVERAVGGELPLSELSPAEREVANAEMSVAISEAANRTSFADRLAAEGVTTVILDRDGHLVERRPDGTVTRL